MNISSSDARYQSMQLNHIICGWVNIKRLTTLKLKTIYYIENTYIKSPKLLYSAKHNRWRKWNTKNSIYEFLHLKKIKNLAACNVLFSLPKYLLHVLLKCQLFGWRNMINIKQFHIKRAIKMECFLLFLNNIFVFFRSFFSRFVNLFYISLLFHSKLIVIQKQTFMRL